MTVFIVGLVVLALLYVLFVASGDSWDRLERLIIGGMSFAGLAVVWLATLDGINAYHAQSARYVCEARGQDYRRFTFTDSVVCIPRFRGSDSLNVNLSR